LQEKITRTDSISHQSGMTENYLPTEHVVKVSAPLEADFGKGEATQYFCHSESLEKYYELANSYFSCYSESVNADGKPINVILNLIQDLLMPMVIKNQTNRFLIKSGMT